MSSLPLKLLAAVLAMTLASVSHAEDAKPRKHKKIAAASTARTTQQHWGTDKFPAGPLYYSGVYLGDDPDPNIRFQIWRDISGRFGGEP
ncbi:MAG TPA: hypothetical protein VEH02_00150 [Pseudolabrys sp.]|nr:hypothetical protein [Pseudolabrys sp.]